jgi:hypothetical protein
MNLPFSQFCLKYLKLSSYSSQKYFCYLIKDFSSSALAERKSWSLAHSAVEFLTGTKPKPNKLKQTWPFKF